VGAGILWVLCAFGALVLVALFSPTPPPRAVTPIHFSPLLIFAPAVAIGAVGGAPYVGVRTHPAFAMFSNLQLEGGHTNHWLISADLGVWFHSQLCAAGLAEPIDSPHHAITILATDLAALRDLQVNLAPLLPTVTLEAFRDTNVTADFYISPPKWGLPPTEPTFRSFATTFLEARRRIAAAKAHQPSLNFFLRYEVTQGGKTTRREYRRRRGRTTSGSDQALEAPLPWWSAALYRYRTFDLSYSPCRH